jgi:hypothetical protein
MKWDCVKGSNGKSVAPVGRLRIKNFLGDPLTYLHSMRAAIASVGLDFTSKHIEQVAEYSTTTQATG